MVSLEWLPLVWLRTAGVAFTLYVIMPRLSIDLKSISIKLKVSSIHVYYTMIAFWEFVTVCIIFYLLTINNLSLSTIGITGGLSLKAVIYVIAGVFISASLYPVVQAMCRFLRWNIFWHRRQDRNWFPKGIDYLNTKRKIISMFLIVVISIPILEEIIYRGYVFTALMQNFQSILPVFALTSIIFASIHCVAGPGSMIYIFLGTFMSSYLYWKFVNIYPCITLHSFNTI